MFKVQDEKFTVNAILYDDINLVLSISREMQDMPDTSVEALRSKPYDFTLEKRGWQWQLCVTVNDKDQVIILVKKVAFADIPQEKASKIRASSD